MALLFGRIFVGKKNYMANYLQKRRAVLGAREGINSIASVIMDC